MRLTIISILTFLAASFSFQANAQVTAVMQAKVNIISGAGLTAINESLIDLSSSNLTKEFEAGSFSLVSAPGVDVNVYIENSSSIKNEFGEIIEFESLKIDKQSTNSGEHHISVNGKVKNDRSLQGHYEGALTAVIEYM